jgi:hypothetical protein
VKVVRNEVLPILNKQPGFLEILPLEPETKTEKRIIITLWAKKRDAERYEREVYPKGGRNREAVPDHPGRLQALQRGNHALPALRGGPDGLKHRPEGPSRSSTAAPASTSAVAQRA